MRRLLPSLLLALILGGAVLGSIYHAIPTIHGWRDTPRGVLHFNDFRIFNRVAYEHADGKPLYRVEQPAYFQPGSSVYKYPPPYAAVLSFHAQRRWRPVAYGYLLADGIALLLAWVVLALGARRPPGGPFQLWDPRGRVGRGLGLLGLLVLWKPFWESLAGIQLELVFVPLLALAFVALERGHRWVEGVVIGACAAFKVYPGLLGIGPALERRWSAVIAGVVAGFVLLVFGAARLGWDETHFYLTEVLPNLGGTSVSPSNLSLVGQIGVHLVGWDLWRGKAIGDLPTLETTGTALQLWSARIGALLILSLLVIATIRALSRVPSDRRGPLRLALSLPLLLLALPTSWFDYQSLLFVPVAWLYFRLPFERRFLAPWSMLIAATLPMVLLDANVFARKIAPILLSSARALAAVGIWGAVLLAAQNGLCVPSAQGDERLDEPLRIDPSRDGVLHEV